MAHRKRKAPAKDASSEKRLKLLALSVDIATTILNRQQEVLELTERPDFQFQPYYHLLEALDQSRTILPRLDRKVIESLKPDVHEAFIRYYTAACVTGMARRPDALKTMVDYGLVTFKPRKDPQTLALMESCPELTPILAPISDDYPYFPDLFLGMYQSRLETILDRADLLRYQLAKDPAKGASPTRRKPETAIMDDQERVLRASELLTPARVMNETREVLRHYLKATMYPKYHCLVDNIADISFIYMFMWLLSMGMFGEIIGGLLGGMPMLRKITRDDLKTYAPSESGTSAPFSLVEFEEE